MSSGPHTSAQTPHSFNQPSPTAAKVDRRVMAMAALGSFYLRQGFPEKAAALLRAADKLIGGEKPVAGFRDAVDDVAEGVARNLAYALLLLGEGDEALSILESGRIRSNTVVDAAAAAHLIARAKRAAARRREAQGGGAW